MTWFSTARLRGEKQGERRKNVLRRVFRKGAGCWSSCVNLYTAGALRDVEGMESIRPTARGIPERVDRSGRRHGVRRCARSHDNRQLFTVSNARFLFNNLAAHGIGAAERGREFSAVNTVEDRLQPLVIFSCT